MLVVQQANFEKTKFEYDVTILIARKQITIIWMISYYMVLLPKSSPFISILRVSQQIKIARCLLLLGGTSVVGQASFSNFKRLLLCQVTEADDHQCYLYDSDPGMLVHLHNISSPLPQFPDQFFIQNELCHEKYATCMVENEKFAVINAHKQLKGLS